MKWMIASDIHGSAYYCRELLEAYDREKADRLLCLVTFCTMAPEMIAKRLQSKGSDRTFKQSQTGYSLCAGKL